MTLIRVPDLLEAQICHEGQAPQASAKAKDMSLIVAHVFAAAGTVDLRCDGVGAQASFV
jgi:hypothetical protein